MNANRIKKFSTVALAIALASFVVAPNAHAEDTAALNGTVTTGKSIGLPGVTVILDGGGMHTLVVSGEGGVWSAAGLAPGTWTVRAELAGFATVKGSDIQVAAGQTRHVQIRLEPATFFDTTAVTGEAPEDLLSAGEIRETSARELDDALTRVAGIHRLRKAGIASDVVVRGYQGGNLNLLVDGVKVQGACPGHMDPPAFHADLAEIDRVEIAPGPFDVKNAGSLGGLVNLVGKRPEPGLGVDSNLAVGSFTYLNPSLTFHGGDARLSFLTGLSYRTSRPFADGQGRQFTELSNFRPSEVDSEAYRVATGWARAAYSPTARQTLQVAYTRQEADHVLYPYLTMDTTVDDTDRLAADYTLAGTGGALAAVRLSAYGTRVYHEMTDEFRTTSIAQPRAYSMGTIAETQSWGGRAEVELGSLTVGADVTRRWWETRTAMARMQYRVQYGVPDVDLEALGLYASYRTALSDRAWLQAGLRVDRATSDANPALADTSLYYAYTGSRSTSASDTFPSGHVRVSALLGDVLEASAGIGSTVRVPDAQERYYALRRMGTDWVGNPALEPTRASGLHVSLATTRTRVAANLTAFWDDLHNYVTLYDQRRINMVPGVMNPKARSYANVDAAMRGVELSASAPLGSRLFLSANAAWVRGTQTARPEDGIRSRDLAEMPPLSSRVSLRWDSGRLFVEGEGVFVAAQDDVNSDVQESRTPGYGVANLRAGGRFKGFSLSATLSNLADRYYRDHLSYQRDPYRAGVSVPEPGRSLTVNLGVNL